NVNVGSVIYSKNKKILKESKNNNVITTTNKSETRSSEIPQYLKKGNRLAFYNIICLFDNTFPYMKNMIEIFGDNQIKIFVEKWRK
ncbi:4930_t:CDS:2, partial [Entrophospora sp. SA101]